MQQESEDPLSQFRERIIELLKDVSYIGMMVEKKSLKYLTKVCRGDDRNNLKDAGLGLINLLGTIEGNITAITNKFEEDLKKVNERSDENMFSELKSKLRQHKTNLFPTELKNGSTSVISSDRATQTDVNSDNNPDMNPKSKENLNNTHRQIKHQSEIEPVASCSKVVTLGDLKARKGLSLKRAGRTDTQDTDDGWTDSLNRSPTGIDLRNGVRKGEINPDTDKGALEMVKKEFVPKEEIPFIIEERKSPDHTAPNSINLVTPKSEPVGSEDGSDIPDSTKEKTPEFANTANIKTVGVIPTLETDTNVSNKPSADVCVDSKDSGGKVQLRSTDDPTAPETENNGTATVTNNPQKDVHPSDVETQQLDGTIGDTDESTPTQSVEEIESNKFILGENDYSNPYSVETVKFGSDTQESITSPCSETTVCDFDIATQVISNEPSLQEPSNEPPLRDPQTVLSESILSSLDVLKDYLDETQVLEEEVQMEDTEETGDGCLKSTSDNCNLAKDIQSLDIPNSHLERSSSPNCGITPSAVEETLASDPKSTKQPPNSDQDKIATQDSLENAKEILENARSPTETEVNLNGEQASPSVSTSTGAAEDETNCKSDGISLVSIQLSIGSDTQRILAGSLDSEKKECDAVPSTFESAELAEDEAPNLEEANPSPVSVDLLAGSDTDWILESSQNVDASDEEASSPEPRPTNVAEDEAVDHRKDQMPSSSAGALAVSNSVQNCEFLESLNGDEESDLSEERIENCEADSDVICISDTSQSDTDETDIEGNGIKSQQCRVGKNKLDYKPGSLAKGKSVDLLSDGEESEAKDVDNEDSNKKSEETKEPSSQASNSFPNSDASASNSTHALSQDIERILAMVNSDMNDDPPNTAEKTPLDFIDNSKSGGESTTGDELTENKVENSSLRDDHPVPPDRHLKETATDNVVQNSAFGGDGCSEATPVVETESAKPTRTSNDNEAVAGSGNELGQGGTDADGCLAGTTQNSVKQLERNVASDECTSLLQNENTSMKKPEVAPRVEVGHVLEIESPSLSPSLLAPNTEEAVKSHSLNISESPVIGSQDASGSLADIVIIESDTETVIIESEPSSPYDSQSLEKHHCDPNEDKGSECCSKGKETGKRLLAADTDDDEGAPQEHGAVPLPDIYPGENDLDCTEKGNRLQSESNETDVESEDKPKIQQVVSQREMNSSDKDIISDVTTRETEEEILTQSSSITTVGDKLISDIDSDETDVDSDENKSKRHLPRLDADPGENELLESTGKDVLTQNSDRIECISTTGNSLRSDVDNNVNSDENHPDSSERESQSSDKASGRIAAIEDRPQSDESNDIIDKSDESKPKEQCVASKDTESGKNDLEGDVLTQSSDKTECVSATDVDSVETDVDYDENKPKRRLSLTGISPDEDNLVGSLENDAQSDDKSSECVATAVEAAEESVKDNSESRLTPSHEVVSGEADLHNSAGKKNVLTPTTGEIECVSTTAEKSDVDSDEIGVDNDEPEAKKRRLSQTCTDCEKSGPNLSDKDTQSSNESSECAAAAEVMPQSGEGGCETAKDNIETDKDNNETTPNEQQMLSQKGVNSGKNDNTLDLMGQEHNEGNVSTECTDKTDCLSISGDRILSGADSDETDVENDEPKPKKRRILSETELDSSENGLDCAEKEDDQSKISSQDSDKSLVFDISENNIDSMEDLSNVSLKTKLQPSECDNEKLQLNTDGQKTEEIDDVPCNDEEKAPAEDVIEALEQLLSIEGESKEKGDVKETIEIDSDSDEDVKLDVTMEEIISAGSSIDCISDDEVIPDTGNQEEDDQVEIVDAANEEQNLTESTVEKTDDLADELLELLREVVVHSDENKNKSNADVKTEIKVDSEMEAKEADEIFKMLQGENSSDISDVDPTDEDTTWDLNSTNVFDDGRKSTELEEKMSQSTRQQLLDEHGMRECYVSIEKLKMEQKEIVRLKRRLDNSVDRLCDLSTLLGKRKAVDSLESREQVKSKKLKRTPVPERSTSDAQSLSELSDSDVELCDIDAHSPILPPPLEQKLDDMLANEICKGFDSSVSDDSTEYESDGSSKSARKKKKEGKAEESRHDDDDDKRQKLTKEERERRSWRQDRLLRGKLTSDSDSSSTSSSERSRRRRNTLKTKYEHDTDFYILSENTDSDSDAEDRRELNRIRLEGKTVSPIKKNLPVSDSDSSDSEVEFVPEQNSPEENDDSDLVSGSQKGRRNIRALMSDESLAEATQRANKEEQERIQRLESRNKLKESLSQSLTQSLSQAEGGEEDLLVLDMDEKTGEPLITVDRKLTRKMKAHQREGVQFMWDSCYESVEMLKSHEGSGCILAHCMGLGKTFQVLALIHTLFSHDVTNTKHVLVVCPLSTVSNWKKEFKIRFKDLSGHKLNILTIADKKEISQKYDIVKKWHLRKKSVLVLGYEGFETLTNESKLEKAGRYLRDRMMEALVDPGPDLVICDEGHLLRNKKALKTMALDRIRTKRRIVLTGTPLQNNLLEYYHMVHFVKRNLLGNMKEYKTNFVNPITNGQYEDSTKDDIKLMMKRTHVLHKLLKKSIQRVEDTELKVYLPKMVDYAVFIQLHQVQVDLYHTFSELVQRNNTDVNRKGFFGDFCIFRYIGTHPHLLSVIEDTKNKGVKERDVITNEQEDNNVTCKVEGWWKTKVPEDAAEKIEYGHKLMFVRSIIEECEEIGDKVLVFSQSLGELDLIEHFLKKIGTTNCPSWQKKVDYFRMDGTVTPEYRSVICDIFNDKDNKKMRLLLMSTKVGGLGLNLTAANRVIIMTVNWNPSFDTQSVFRVYRFGQDKEVFVYRLISLDTMEEKVYQRTVTKLAIAHRVVDKHQITRHYKSMDLQELYSCRPSAGGERPTPNLPEDRVLAQLILKLPFIYKYHEHQALLANRPEDNLNEQELNAAWDEFKRIKGAPKVPPPPASQVTMPNGPTFNQAYALSNANQVPVAGNSNLNKMKVSVNKQIEEIIKQYYVAKPSDLNLQDKAKSMAMPRNTTIIDLNTIKQKVKLPADTVIEIAKDAANPGKVALPAASNAELDPLYIPQLAQSGKTNNSYSQMLAMYVENQGKIPSLPASIVIEDDSPIKNNQKENLYNTKMKLPKPLPNAIVIDDESEKRKSKAPNLVLSENVVKEKQVRPEVVNANNLKRKHDQTSPISDTDKKKLLKKMKDKFAPFVASQLSISLQDDDDDCVDVSEVTDTSAETGSVSKEIIKNLGLSEISIHKVMRDAKMNNNVITLD